MRIPLQRVSKRIRKRSRMGQSVVPTKKKKSKIVEDTVAETIALVVKGKFTTKSTVLAKNANVVCKDLKVLAIKKGPGRKKSENFPAKDLKRGEKRFTAVKLVKKTVIEMAKKVTKEKKEPFKKPAATVTATAKKETVKKLKKTTSSENYTVTESPPNVIPLPTNVKQEDSKEVVNNTNNKLIDKSKNKVVKEPKNCAKKVKSETADATKQTKSTAAKRQKSPPPKTDPPLQQQKEPSDKVEKQKKVAPVKEKKLDNKVKKDGDTLKAKKAITKVIKQNSKTLVNEAKQRKSTALKAKNETAQLVKPSPKPESNSTNQKAKKDVKSSNVAGKQQKLPVAEKTETATAVKTEAEAPRSGSPTKDAANKPKKRTERRIKTEESTASTDDTSTTSDEITLDVLRQNRYDAEPPEPPAKQPLKSGKKIKVEQSSDTEKKPPAKSDAARKGKAARGAPPAKKNAVAAAAAVKAKPKMVLMKKRVLKTAKDKSKGLEEQRMRRMKLFGFWTGPKRHRVASLNALAKVHCLYENETRGAILDSLMDTAAAVKAEPPAKEDKPPKVDKVVVVEEAAPKMSLRSTPGIRAIGKHWDMHDTSSTESSSEDNNSNDSTYHYPTRLLVPPPSYKQKLEKMEKMEKLEKQETAVAAAVKKTPEVAAKGAVKRRRNRTEIIMDLKDMVVRKRMASLNASAILAASYSVEKRTVRSPKTEDTDETTAGEDSSDVSSMYKGGKESASSTTASTTKKKCYEADVVKSEDESNGGGVRDMSKVCVTPNKKVAVILNQDTDVTITGVYVNSTTRSTHHEGFCTVAGMQYRISATSHTQTAATAVATETLLHHSTAANTEHTNAEQPCKSYTPLGALSSMQPPGAPGAVQHGAPLSPMARRGGHGCPSAFSAPPGGPYGPPTHHHPPPPNQPPDQPPPGFIHGYYQPAGPLITAPHNHAPPPQITKTAPQPETSPSPTPPPPHNQAPASSAGESSDNDVIITSVTSGTEPTVPPPQPPPTYRYSQYPAAPPPGYPYTYPAAQYYPPPAPAYSHHELCYPPGPYLHHKTYAPPYRRYLQPQNAPQYYPTNPAELYSSPPASNQQNSQVRMLQVVTASPSVAGSAYQQPPNGPPPTLVDSYPPGPPALVEPYPAHYYASYGPPACYSHSPPTRNLAFIDPATYQSCPCPMQSCPKNVHTGPLTGDGKRSHISSIAKESIPLPPVALALPLEPASATGPPSPARGSAGMPPPPSPAGATYQPPLQAQAQQWDTKQETIDCKTTEKRRKARVGKTMVRNNIAAHFPDQHNTMLLMCQAPSDVSKVKREVESPEEVKVSQKTEEMIKVDVKNIEPTVTNLSNVEVVSSKCEQTVEEAVNPPQPSEQTQTEIICMKTEKETLANRTKTKDPDPPAEEKEAQQDLDNLPIQKTVAETVKFTSGERQNNIIKRKLSITRESEKSSGECTDASPDKKLKVEKPKLSPTGSYKDLIKKSNSVMKINNGKRKLIANGGGATAVRSAATKKLISFKSPRIAIKKKTLKRKLGPQTKEETATTKRMKSSKPLIASNLHNSKQNVKNAKSKSTVPLATTELSENTEPANKTTNASAAAATNANKKLTQVNNNNNNNNNNSNNNNNKIVNKKTGPALLDSLFAKNNVDRTIESVVNAASVVLIRTNSSNVAVSCKAASGGTVAAAVAAAGPGSCGAVDKSLCEIKSTNNKLALNKQTNCKETCVKATTTATATAAVTAAASKRKTKSKSVEVEPMLVPKVPRKSLQLPRWSNGWSWEGEPFQGKIFLNSDEALVMRNCYPAMRHIEGDLITPWDCVLLKAGARKIDLPFVAKVAALWENPEDGEMMMSLLWYYRPEHTDKGRRPEDHADEVFASRHKDTNSVACIEDKCYVLTFNEYCRYRKALRRLDAENEDTGQLVPLAETYPRSHRQPPSALTSSELVLFCRSVYDFRQKKMIRNPS